MFTPETIHARLRERRFVPLRIITSSGQVYDVYHPELVLIGHRFLIVGTPSNDNPSFIQQASRLAILHISDLQDLPSPAAPGANGA